MTISKITKLLAKKGGGITSFYERRDEDDNYRYDVISPLIDDLIYLLGKEKPPIADKRSVMVYIMSGDAVSLRQVVRSCGDKIRPPVLMVVRVFGSALKNVSDYSRLHGSSCYYAFDVNSDLSITVRNDFRHNDQTPVLTTSVLQQHERLLKLSLHHRLKHFHLPILWR